MALITCPECKKKISDTAVSCPNCGDSLSPVKMAEVKKKELQVSKDRKMVCLAVFLILAILCIASYLSDPWNLTPTAQEQKEISNKQTELSAPVYFQDSETQANVTFKKIVNNYESFFKSPQKMLSKQLFTDSKSGYVYSIEEYECVNISYDIQKTDSLISPYLGIINLDLISKDNGACGDVRSVVRAYGWSNSADAIKHSGDSECFRDLLDKPFIDPVRLYFAYQDSKWVLKKVIRTNYNHREPIISATYGVEVEEGRNADTSEEKAFNKKWLDVLN